MNLNLFFRLRFFSARMLLPTAHELSGNSSDQPATHPRTDVDSRELPPKDAKLVFIASFCHLFHGKKLRSNRVVSQSLPNQYLADPDVQLMLRVVSDDHLAFEELVERYQDRLIGFFYHLLGDRTVSEDLAQDAFLRIYRARERYQASARFSTWLFRIAHNLASNQLRGMAKRKKDVSLAARSSGSQEVRLADRSALMPTRQLVSREVQTQVREAMDCLGERQRMAVLLHKFEGMSYQDIANVMGLNEVAVKSLLARARGKLKIALEKFA